MAAGLRTPDERFNALPDFSYAPNYLDNLKGCEGLRMHYVDEGPRDAGPGPWPSGNDGATKKYKRLSATP
jgi:hypothetical protein